MLRTVNPSYLSGVWTGAGDPPLPIAIATGPDNIVINNTVTDAAWWGVTVPMPALANVMWVLTSADIRLRWEVSLGPPSRLAFFARGVLTDVDDTQGPVKAAGLTSYVAGVPGTFAGVTGPVDDGTSATRIWEPLDPAGTVGGFTPMGIARNDLSASVTAGDWELDMSGVRFIGYPVNYWGTGHLWATAMGS